jgi:hypothetical protein
MARETACGEWFDTHELTAAQPTLPFGTRFARDKRRYRKIRDGSGNPVCCVAAVALKARHRCSGPARTSCSAGIGIHCFVIDQRRRLFGVWFDLVVWHYLLPIDNVRRLFRTRSRFIPTAHQLLSSSESISAFPPRSGCGPLLRLHRASKFCLSVTVSFCRCAGNRSPAPITWTGFAGSWLWWLSLLGRRRSSSF